MSADPDFETEYHPPVLPREILAAARPVLSELPRPLIADGTLGDGGHSLLLLEAFPAARLIACDRDPAMLDRARRRLGAAGLLERAELIRANYSELSELLTDRDLRPDFLLLDLGVSMFHFRGAGRGFSYTDDSLDMRLDAGLAAPAGEGASSAGTPTAAGTHGKAVPGGTGIGGDPPGFAGAARLVNTAPSEELARIFRELGEEPRARQIARAIERARPLGSARELAELIAGLPGMRPGRSSDKRKSSPNKKGARNRGVSRIHPATRVFQALRMAVNDETPHLERALATLPPLLNSGGRLAVISFHSLEDRPVKQAFRKIGAPDRSDSKNRAKRERYRAQTGEEFLQDNPAAGQPHEEFLHPDPAYAILTRRPIIPGPEEQAENPASRSAKLRLLERRA